MRFVFNKILQAQHIGITEEIFKQQVIFSIGKVKQVYSEHHVYVLIT